MSDVVVAVGNVVVAGFVASAVGAVAPVGVV